MTASRQLTVAAIQMACGHDSAANLAKAEDLVRRAAAKGAGLILLPELFETPYFCKDQLPEHFALARPLDGNPVIARFAAIAKELGVVLPISFFERAGQAYFNALALIDADGAICGHYRKSHIPDGPGYQEKYYFSPGDTGFTPVPTRAGHVGAAICWDQWFPETARVLALRGAEVLLYPTAIGSEPQEPTYDSCAHWRRVMQGHAAANLMPLVASNRVGTETGRSCSITFYGSSFIAGPQGELVAEARRDEETILTASFDLDRLAQRRTGWGIFRDRRPELYRPILSLDGSA
ncbi:MAG TPA: N-carbamoylputrescine amidase [Alphaproteobacteria bacterium]|nr:N-carbamoylputrescine amidase [Alphaproteobacteria bacterium]